MLTTSQIKSGLENVSAGFRAPKDELFTENQSLIPKYTKLGVITNNDEDHTSPDVDKFYCNIPGCARQFDDVQHYQTHFNSVHRFPCVECRRMLPSAHLLDLHLSEQHDAYFAAKLARANTPMYACFLEECKCMMETSEQRKKHCMDVHKFTTNFRFYEPKEKSDKKKQRKKNCEGKHEELKMKLENVLPPGADEAMIDIDVEKIPTVKTKFRTFSFGHQRKETFHTNKGSQSVSKLDDLNELAEALKDV